MFMNLWNCLGPYNHPYTRSGSSDDRPPILFLDRMAEATQGHPLQVVSQNTMRLHRELLLVKFRQRC